jgi:hypothetical protein
MVKHELFGKHLRIGNFLYRIAWSVMIKHKFGIETIYPKNYYLWKYLQNPPQLGEYPEEYDEASMLRPRKWEWSEEEEQFVNDFVLSHKDQDFSVALNFFFQSEKWFRDSRMGVWLALQFKEEVKHSIFEKYNTLFDKSTIGIGIRLGDFVGHGDFYQIKTDWYISALNTYFPNWREDYNVVIFSDDIGRAKAIFSIFDFLYADPNGTQTHADNFKHYHGDASEQFILGTMMDNWIIGNSTFSWWQAWLATYANEGRVIHSGKVFSETGNMKHVDTKDYYPERWLKHELN